MRVTTISSKQQITIPMELLLALNMKPQGKVLLEPDGKKLVIRSLKNSIVEETAGSLTKYVRPAKLGKPFSEILEITKKKVAGEIARK